jgi:putative addiction module component (TIGR02574 family)
MRVMGDASRKLLDEALALPEDEREVLAIELLESLGPREVGWQDEWTAEIERRLEEVRSGKVELRAWDDVHAELRARLAQQRQR